MAEHSGAVAQARNDCADVLHPPLPGDFEGGRRRHGLAEVAWSTNRTTVTQAPKSMRFSCEPSGATQSLFWFKRGVIERAAQVG